MAKRIFWLLLLCALTLLVMGLMVVSADESQPPQGLLPIVFFALPAETSPQPEISLKDTIPKSIPSPGPKLSFGGSQSLATPASLQPDVVWRFFAFHLPDKAG